jgi:hypothetical protein
LAVDPAEDGARIFRATLWDFLRRNGLQIHKVKRFFVGFLIPHLGFSDQLLMAWKDNS